MTEEVQRYFHRLMKMVTGLHAILVTDRDGVPVLKVSDGNSPDMAMTPKFLATSGMAMEQAGKLGLSFNKTVVTEFANYQVVCFNKLPLIITMIADISANTGMMLDLDREMKDALQDIKSAVDVS